MRTYHSNIPDKAVFGKIIESAPTMANSNTTMMTPPPIVDRAKDPKQLRQGDVVAISEKALREHLFVNYAIVEYIGTVSQYLANDFYEVEFRSKNDIQHFVNLHIERLDTSKI